MNKLGIGWLFTVRTYGVDVVLYNHMEKTQESIVSIMC